MCGFITRGEIGRTDHRLAVHARKRKEGMVGSPSSIYVERLNGTGQVFRWDGYRRSHATLRGRVP